MAPNVETVAEAKPESGSKGKRPVRQGLIRQRVDFRNGNEAAAMAARDIGFHLMGYFPITPSTEVAETLSEMQAEGTHDIVMVPGRGALHSRWESRQELGLDDSGRGRRYPLDAERSAEVRLRES